MKQIRTHIKNKKTSILIKHRFSIFVKEIVKLNGDIKKSLMIGDSETDANAAKSASIPIILIENGYTERNTNDIYHNHLIKDFVGIEKIISQYLND